MTLKLCKTCKTRRRRSSFTVNRRNSDGLETECRDCYASRQRSWRRKNDPTLIERDALFRETPIGQKTCRACIQTKPVSAFLKKPNGGKDGLNPRCRQCVYNGHKIWRDANPEKKAAAFRASYVKSPRHALRLALTNGKARFPTKNPITVDQLMALYESQRGLCALSGVRMTWASGRGRPMPTSLSIDRIRQEEGYVLGNVRLVAFSANAYRNTMTDDEMRDSLATFYGFQFPAPGAVGAVLGFGV